MLDLEIFKQQEWEGSLTASKYTDSNFLEQKPAG